jgi:hypothetical protein
MEKTQRKRKWRKKEPSSDEQINKSIKKTGRGLKCFIKNEIAGQRYLPTRRKRKEDRAKGGRQMK